VASENAEIARQGGRRLTVLAIGCKGLEKDRRLVRMIGNKCTGQYGMRSEVISTIGNQR
jgi:hypothetical protein